MGASNRDKIRNAVAELGRADACEIHQGKVLSVNETEATMNVEVLGLTYYDVRLRSVVTDTTGFWVVPKVNSFVIIGQIDGGQNFVLIRPSEVDKVIGKIGTKSFEFTSSGFIFNNGTNDGVPLVNPLVSRINAIENLLNDLASKYNAHTHTVNVVTTCGSGAGTGTGTATSTPSVESTVLSNTTASQLANPDVKQ